MKTKVLYVEDEDGWQSMVGTFLKLSGYEVLPAKDADSALAQCERADVGIIILDLNLAGTNASQLVGFLKTNHPAVQLILYTGMPEAEASFKALVRQGADQCLQKGHLRDLLTAVEAAARRVALSLAARPQPVLNNENAPAAPASSPALAAA